MADLIPPHGGVSQPLDLSIPEAERGDALARCKELEKVPVSDADLSTVYRFGDGALSPLTGPMDGRVYNRVLDEAVIEHDGKRYAWTIPLSLPVDARWPRKLKPGKTVGARQLGRARSSPRSTSATSSSGTSRATSRASI